MGIFTEDFSTDPWWWQGFRPPEGTEDLPARAGTLVIGAGYAGTEAFDGEIGGALAGPKAHCG